MSTHNGQITLFDRFRRTLVLRVVFLAAALLASQSSLACAFEAVFAAQETELSIVVVGVVQSDAAAASADHAGEDCCSLCVDCAYCGGCCSFAVTARLNAAHLSLASIADANLSLATAAPTLWKPPTLLRPPINAA